MTAHKGYATETHCNASVLSLGLTALLVLALLSLPLAAGTERIQAQAGSRTFPETGKTVRGRFLDYWQKNGGLAQQGFPISEEMQERSDTDGRVYTVQYFERAIFESHPENREPYDVLLSLLGNFLYKQKYPNGAPAQQANNTPGSALYRETGKRLGGVFLEYWREHGGLAQQGYPISDEFQEKSDLNGKTYRVQYFEQAVFEYHTENKPPYDVLLSQLGTFRYRAKYLQSTPTPASGPPTVITRPTTAPTSTRIPTATVQPAPTPGGNGHEVRLTLIEWAIVPGQVEVPAGNTVFWVTNDSPGMHNLTVIRADGQRVGGTPNFTRQESPQTFEADMAPGTYQMLCTLPGHAQAGQRGTIVVR